MPTLYVAPVDYARVSMLRKAWERELRRRGLSSTSRISSIAHEKAMRGVMPPAVRP